MKKLAILLLQITLLCGHACASNRPHVLLILADDLGYGDLRCYNAQSKVPTPNIDLLAREGMRFTDTHSPATVCTPSRYSLMTGQMAFRVPNGGIERTQSAGLRWMWVSLKAKTGRPPA